MLKTILSGSSLNRHNILSEAMDRAIEGKLGVDAIIKKNNGRSAKVLLRVDNHQILFKQKSRLKTFVIDLYKEVTFPART